MKAIGKQEETIKVKTDVHKFARKFASFNYLWTFKITAPVQHCCLELSLLDDDRFISDDMIYLPKKLALESFMDFAYKHVKDDGMSSSSVKHLIVFDQTPREAPTCCDSCIKGTEKNQYSPNLLKICVFFFCWGEVQGVDVNVDVRSDSSQILRSASIGPPLGDFFVFHSNFYRAVVLSSSGCCPSFPTFDFRHLNDPCQAAVESVFSVGGAAIVVPRTSSRQRCAWNWKYLQMLGLIGSQALSGHFC